MILDQSARSTLERYKRAKEAESAAIEHLHSALASGERDMEVLRRLTEDMEQKHYEAMSIYRELEALRLDKPKGG
jgi:hypothetical protein